MSQRTFHGVPRSKIPWYPTIDYGKCLSCGECLKYCKHDVYEFEEKQGKRIPFVKNADNCIVYCNGCDAIYPSGAISIPQNRGLVR
jgi:NAD-dependent dihydropyrimidine dehydrogenase PreA subunit